MDVSIHAHSPEAIVENLRSHRVGDFSTTVVVYKDEISTYSIKQFAGRSEREWFGRDTMINQPHPPEHTGATGYQVSPFQTREA